MIFNPKPALLFAAAFSTGCAQVSPPSVILTTDVGVEVDDQWAIAYLLLASDAGQVDVRGIVTTHAPSLRPPAAESSAAQAREVMTLVSPRRKPPVIPGSSVPLKEKRPGDAGAGASFIVEASGGFSPQHRLVILSIGAATDIAAAIRLDPQITNRIEVVAMGFERWPEGGDPWNVKNDPLAYQIILESSVPLTLGAADVCERHLTLDGEGSRRQTQNGGKVGQYLQKTFDDWLLRKEDLCRKMTGRLAWPIWDVVTLAHIWGWTAAEVRPRPRLRDDLTFDPSSPTATMRWITAIEGEKVWADFRAKLGSAR
jgi:inosine-uridine nucleoside N-ribohydrolase